MVEEVKATYKAQQQELDGLTEEPDFADIVKRTVEIYLENSIDIPRIVVVPDSEVNVVFEPFELDCSSIRLQANDRTIIIQDLQSNEREELASEENQDKEPRPENYLVRCLMDYDDINYDKHAEVLYNLAGQMVAHLTSYLNPEEVVTVLKHSQKRLAEFIYRQMMQHQREEATSYTARVTRGFSDLKPCAYTVDSSGNIHNFRNTPENLSKIRQMAFGGFSRCLYPIQKFDSDSERKFSIILESDDQVKKWFKPGRGQFQIFYRDNHQFSEYQPDFVVETEEGIFLCEPKASNEMEDATVLAKRDAAVEWCKHASAHASENEGKPWTYALIPHDAIQTNKSLKAIVDEFGEG
jgi:type III restriction enzyme